MHDDFSGVAELPSRGHVAFVAHSIMLLLHAGCADSSLWLTGEQYCDGDAQCCTSNCRTVTDGVTACE